MRPVADVEIRPDFAVPVFPDEFLIAEILFFHLSVIISQELFVFALLFESRTRLRQDVNEYIDAFVGEWAIHAEVHRRVFVGNRGKDLRRREIFAHFGGHVFVSKIVIRQDARRRHARLFVLDAHRFHHRRTQWAFVEPSPFIAIEHIHTGDTVIALCNACANEISLLIRDFCLRHVFGNRKFDRTIARKAIGRIFEVETLKRVFEPFGRRETHALPLFPVVVFPSDVQIARRIQSRDGNRIGELEIEANPSRFVAK